VSQLLLDLGQCTAAAVA